jgi:hypothetical protein
VLGAGHDLLELMDQIGPHLFFVACHVVERGVDLPANSGRVAVRHTLNPLGA